MCGISYEDLARKIFVHTKECGPWSHDENLKMQFVLSFVDYSSGVNRPTFFFAYSTCSDRSCAWAGWCTGSASSLLQLNTTLSIAG